MFSREKSIRASKDQIPNLTEFIDISFLDFLEKNGLCGGFLCLWDEEVNDMRLLATQVIPMAPFKGTRRTSLESFVKDCLRQYPAPHIHAMSDSELWKEIRSVVDTSKWQSRGLFLPVSVKEKDFVIICFSKKETKLEITEEICSNCLELVRIANSLSSADDLENRLRVMETYVREIGHDIASSVQAILAKLRNVSRGFVDGPAALAKIREAEGEIMATYRIAETLGITVDPDFNIGTGSYFNPEAVVQEVLMLCQSEAVEDHVELRTELPDHQIELWGDVRAIQSALLQLVMNAIKYARGSSYVTIRAGDSHGRVEFSVTDRGIPVPLEDELHMWEFGWRGSKAKELHVNGSGIGLYTVKKIAKAHGGSASFRRSVHSNDIVTFSFEIPKKDMLKKSALL